MKTNIIILISLFLLKTTCVSSQFTTLCNQGNGFVDNFEVYNNELYATGFFTNVCGTTANYIVKWNGTTWNPVGNGLNNAGHHLQTLGTDLFAAIYQPAVDSNWLYKFDGTQFNKFGEGVYLSTAVPGFSQTANLYNVIEYDSSIIVCGEFDKVGNKNISGIIKWNGSEWDSLSSGLLGNIPGTAPVMYPHDMCIFNNDLIVSGNFRYAGMQTVNGIARWDGTSWHAFGQGMNSTVYAVCVYNGELYAAGDFTIAGTNAVNYIAKWNGGDWIDPGFGLFYIDPVDYTFIHTMKVINNILFISGGFDRAVSGTDTMLCSAITAYNGINIDTLTGGVQGIEIEAMAFYDGNLIAGGGLFGSSSIVQYDFLNSRNDLGELRMVDVYPNPSSSDLNVRSENLIEEIKIFDSTGMFSGRINCNGKNKVSFQIEKNGIYFIEIKTDEGVIMKKVCIID